MDNDLLRLYVKLQKEKREQDLAFKKKKAECAEVEEKLLKEFEEAGMQSANVDGMTVYLHRQLHASTGKLGKAAVIAALKETGMDEYVSETFSPSSISAFVREMDGNGQELPQKLKDTLNIYEKFSLLTRKGV